MPILFNGNKIIPVEFVTVAYEPARDGATTQLARKLDITLRGKLSALKGSPNSQGVFWNQPGYPPDENLTPDQRLTSLLAKEKALRALFSTDWGSLEIQPWDGAQSTVFQVILKDIEFGEGPWVEVAPFTIKLESYDTSIVAAREASNQWSIELLDEKLKTYRLTHAVSATGVPTVDTNGHITAQAWENARAYCLTNIGLGIDFGQVAAAGVLNLNTDNVHGYNYVRSQRTDERAGSFSVQETWVCYDPQGGPAALDDFTVETRLTEQGLNRVSVQGTISGFEVRDVSTYALQSTRWDNAQAKWAAVSAGIFARAQGLSGLSLNAVVLATTVGRNQNAGTINYNYEYDNRASNTIPGAITESVSVNDHLGADVYASIPVPNDPLGPVLQAMGTITAKKRLISIEAQLNAASQTATPTKPNTNAVVAGLVPSGLQVFLDQDESTWVERSGRYTRSVAFTWK